MDSTAAIFYDNLALEIVKHLPSILWFFLACTLVILFYRPVRYELLPNLAGLKAMGVEFSFVKHSITTAIELAEKSPQWKVVIADVDRENVLKRVKQHLELFREVRVLWIDDVPDSLRNERKMLQRLQMDIDLAPSSAAAEKMLQENDYDLILSDMARHGDNTAGLQFLEKYAQRPKRVPFIFYVGTLDPTKGVPPYAFGITNRPDELLHLILDALERVKA